jgi:hypothetical protein
MANLRSAGWESPFLMFRGGAGDGPHVLGTLRDLYATMTSASSAVGHSTGLPLQHLVAGSDQRNKVRRVDRAPACPELLQ